MGSEHIANLKEVRSLEDLRNAKYPGRCLITPSFDDYCADY